MIDGEGEEQLAPETLSALWAGAAPIEVPLPGSPACSLQIDPHNGTLHLRTAYQTPEPNLAALRNVDFHAFAMGGEDIAEITVRVDEGGLLIGYGFLAAIAAQLQQERLPLGDAVARAVAHYRDLAVFRSPLPVEREVGLLGELLFLEFTIGALGASPAIDAWHGPLAEEHDFALDDVHVEVKTTASERRVHVIHGVDQLAPQHGVPLVLLSVQLTRSSPGTGRTLPEVIAGVRASAGTARSVLDAKLSKLGWADFDADLHDSPWSIRSAPLAYIVDDDFPAITSSRLSEVIPHLGQVVDVSYRVDLTDRIPCQLPDPFTGFTIWSEQ
ncbi:PD-(D/E)XK motif protein [Agromyces sp. SYSU K20354]|uniref:PD-(D/E)XK motif protein n=1 Tax=Agromyces cavernae TaxID=2898659 RepID=UPI001E591D1B|nr:PD-(D/E)XK motif protein [Agromyces cavernae]MCD2441443.1 PD-(D/E)XK motif protein [Agromyces cavernae]